MYVDGFIDEHVRHAFLAAVLFTPRAEHSTAIINTQISSHPLRFPALPALHEVDSRKLILFVSYPNQSQANVENHSHV